MKVIRIIIEIKDNNINFEISKVNITTTNILYSILYYTINNSNLLRLVYYIEPEDKIKNKLKTYLITEFHKELKKHLEEQRLFIDNDMNKLKLFNPYLRKNKINKLLDNEI